MHYSNILFCLWDLNKIVWEKYLFFKNESLILCDCRGALCKEGKKFIETLKCFFLDVWKSRCLIHNALIGKILSFCRISDLKITHLEIIFNKLFCLILNILIQTGHSEIKNYYISSQFLLEKISKSYVKNTSELYESGTRVDMQRHKINLEVQTCSCFSQ
jgi:hypothetical protein